MLKIGFDFGQTTFTMMRIEARGIIKPVPNLNTLSYANDPSAILSRFIFDQKISKWRFACVEEPSVCDLFSEVNEANLIGILRFLKEKAENIQKPIQHVVVAKPVFRSDERVERISHALKEAGWTECESMIFLDETLAAVFGSKLYENFEEQIGKTHNIIILDGRTDTLWGGVYSISLMEKESGGYHFGCNLLYSDTIPKLSGSNLTGLLKARLKEIAYKSEAGAEAFSEWKDSDWEKLVREFCEDALLSPLVIMGSKETSEGYLWEGPPELDCRDIFTVFEGMPLEDDSLKAIDVKSEIKEFLYTMFEELHLPPKSISQFLICGGTMHISHLKDTIISEFGNYDLLNQTAERQDAKADAIVGYGCAKYLSWCEKYRDEGGVSYDVQKEVGNYLGIGIRDELGQEKFFFCINCQTGGTRQTFQCEIKEMLSIPIYRGKQNSDLQNCEYICNLNFLPEQLKILPGTKIAFRMSLKGENFIYEIINIKTQEKLIERKLCKNVNRE